MTFGVKACPVCSGQDSQMPLIEIPDMPVFCNVLLPDKESAMCAPRGDIHLVFCRQCGHVYNKAFDPSKTEYSPNYENSLQFSPRFREYVAALAKGLVERFSLKGKTIIEIGCGKGDFLNLLCQLGENQGLGFDPSFEDERIAEKDRSRFKVIRDYYSEKYSNLNCDLLVCRQVLEHLDSPRTFLNSVRQTVGDRPGTVIFFEVPDVMYTLKDHGIWDLIYEHCNYFTTASLAHLFEETDFALLSVKSVFGGQYLCLEAHPGRRNDLNFVLEQGDLAIIASHAASFADQYRRKVAQWQDILHGIKQKGQQVAVWGAGSKGVTFVNIMRQAADIAGLVDINPHKQGHHVPITGQKVVGLDKLKSIGPDVIIVMNALYENEIREMMSTQNVSCEILSA